jgi:hypothetical protein
LCGEEYVYTDLKREENKTSCNNNKKALNPENKKNKKINSSAEHIMPDTQQILVPLS